MGLSEIELQAKVKALEDRVARLEEYVASNTRVGSSLSVTTRVHHNEKTGTLGDVLEHTDVAGNSATHQKGKLAQRVGIDRPTGEESLCMDATGKAGLDHRVVVQDSSGRWVCVSGHVS